MVSRFSFLSKILPENYFKKASFEKNHRVEYRVVWRIGRQFFFFSELRVSLFKSADLHIYETVNTCEICRSEYIQLPAVNDTKFLYLVNVSVSIRSTYAFPGNNTGI